MSNKKSVLNNNHSSPLADLDKKAEILENLIFSNPDESKRKEFLEKHNSPLLNNLSKNLLDMKRTENIQSIDEYHQNMERFKQDSLNKALNRFKRDDLS